MKPTLKDIEIKYKEQVAKVVLLQARHVISQRELGQMFASSVKLDFWTDQIGERLVTQLTAKLLGNTVHIEKMPIESLYTKRFPETWWDHFKERWFPEWLKRRYPVKWTEITTLSQQIIHHNHVCPHSNRALADFETHLSFLFTDDTEEHEHE